jgi:hypothetical protein
MWMVEASGLPVRGPPGEPYHAEAALCGPGGRVLAGCHVGGEQGHQTAKVAMATAPAG